MGELEFKDPFSGFARSFTLGYALCYILSPLMGLYCSTFGIIGSAAFMIIVGGGLYATVKYHNKYILVGLLLLEAMGTIGHFLQIIPWIPQFSDYAYTSMAILDLVQVVCLIKIWETIKNRD